MTKHVRIENADLSDHKVTIEVWEKAPQSINDPLSQGPDVLVQTLRADYPTQMHLVMIHSSRYIVVREG